jgi:hypothetical protein
MNIGKRLVLFGMFLSIVTGLMVSLTVALARAALFLIPGGVARN